MTKQELSLEEILELEPEIKRIADRVISEMEDYPSLWHAYSDCKRRVSEFVGWDAENDDLRTSGAYDLVIRYLCDRLKV